MEFSENLLRDIPAITLCIAVLFYIAKSLLKLFGKSQEAGEGNLQLVIKGLIDSQGKLTDSLNHLALSMTERNTRDDQTRIYMGERFQAIERQLESMQKQLHFDENAYNSTLKKVSDIHIRINALAKEIPKGGNQCSK